MSDQWCPGIRQVCDYWRDAPMLHHTFDALCTSLAGESDGAIDAAKGIVECVCRLIIDQLDDPSSPKRPAWDAPITTWVGTSIRLLAPNDDRNRNFADLIAHHNGQAEALRKFRNESGPLSHGKDAFVQALSSYHRRSAALMADSIVCFLHNAYLNANPNLARTREPYERFSQLNEIVDRYVTLQAESTDDGTVAMQVRLPDGNVTEVRTEVSRLLFQLDRDAYIEALNSARSADSVAATTTEDPESAS